MTDESPATMPSPAPEQQEQGDSARTATSSSSNKASKKKWFPLESNPSLMNDYVEKLGFDTSLYHFTDVFSTEEWALGMIPQPVAAVLMLYPLTPVQLEHEQKEKAAAANNNNNKSNDNVWFIKQRIGNACGTIGLLHSLLNTPEGLRVTSVRPSSWLDAFSNDCPIPLDPIAKAERLENDDTVAKLHDKATSDDNKHNQTSRGHIDDKLITHFVALVHVNGGLYELDGRKSGPVRHGDTTPMTLLKDACGVVQTFMKRDPTEMRFTIMALAPKQDD